MTWLTLNLYFIKSNFDILLVTYIDFLTSWTYICVSLYVCIYVLYVCSNYVWGVYLKIQKKESMYVCMYESIYLWMRYIIHIILQQHTHTHPQKIFANYLQVKKKKDINSRSIKDHTDNRRK